MQGTELNSATVTPSPRRYRKDVAGLRGLAVALVVFFHVFDGRVSAGVDVFLLLGGFYFFASQIRNSANVNGVRLWQSIVRLLRRLAPALVLMSVVVTAFVLLTSGTWTWARKLSDTSAAVGYYMNWRLISAGQTYGEAGGDVSVFQHLWSMSVQMQVYIGSLVLFAVGTLILNRFCRFTRSSSTSGASEAPEDSAAEERRFALVKSVAVAILVLLTALSFCYATYMVEQNQMVNYYSTLSRFWEVGLGGLAGIVMANASVSAGTSRVLGVVGLSLILITPFTIDGVQQFPGPWTLVPLTGALLIVLAGQTDGPLRGVNGILEKSPFQFLGKISYSLYLWHWPILILLMAALDLETHSVAVGLVVVVASVALAAATHRWIEVPLQERSRGGRAWPSLSELRDTVKRDLRKTAAGIMVILAVVPMLLSEQLFNQVSLARAQAINSAAEETHLGALALDSEQPAVEGIQEQDTLVSEDSTEEPRAVAPDLVALRGMLPITQSDGCYSRFEDTDIVLTHRYGASDEPCLYGDVESERQMYIVGGSHSEHFLPALDMVGKKRGFAVVPILKMGCPLNKENPLWDGEPYTECLEWSDTARQWVVENPPSEGVFMTSTRPGERDEGGGDLVPDGYVEVVEEFSEAGITTVAVRDNPWAMHVREGQLDVRICIAEGQTDCGFEDRLGAVNPAEAAYDGLDVRHVNLHERFCLDGYCPAVIGDVLVYRDSHHITNLYALTLADELERQMFPEDTSLPE